MFKHFWLKWIVVYLISMNSIALAVDYPFKDNVNNKLNWVTTGSWALTTLSYHSSDMAWTDSMTSAYPNNADMFLSLSTPIALSQANNPALIFWQHYELEPDFDFGYVEISDDGDNWFILSTVTGISKEWEKQQIDLSSYVPSSVFIRFRLVSDKTIVSDGWYIDDIRIADKPEPVMQLQVEPSQTSSSAVDLTWTQSYEDNFISYNIFRSLDENFKQQKTLISTISDPVNISFSDSNLEAGRTYYYRVFVANSFDAESGSKSISVTTTSLLYAYPFFDNAETVNSRWTPSEPWGLEILPAKESHSGVTTTVWTDSPYASYGAESDSYLQISIDLGKAIMPVLSCKQKYSFNTNSDYGFVEVKETTAASWTKISFFTGSESTWYTEKIDLSEYAGKTIDLRFRLTSDANGQQSQGWFIDDIRIDETDHEAIPFPFHDEMEDASSDQNWHSSSWKMVSVDDSTHSAYTDSPVGNYGAQVNSALIMSGVIDLLNANRPKLVFHHLYSFLHEYYHCSYTSRTETDYGKIYISTFFGHPGTWEEIGSFYSTQSSWKQHEIDLQKWAGLSNIRLKFVISDRLHPIGCNKVSEGWTIDNITISEAPTPIQLNQPTNIKKHSIQLTWTKNTDNDFSKYIIYRSPTTNSAYELLTEITSQEITEYTDTTITSPNSTYYYKIILQDTENLTTESNEVFATSAWGIPAIQYPMSDDMEGADNFGNDLPWKITNEDAHSGSYSWSDSPDGSYGNDNDKSLYFKLNLGNAKRPLLTFWHRYNMETDADYGYVNISKDNGTTWVKKYYATGFSGIKWEKVEINLSDYANQEIFVRFQMKTNASNTFDGWYIDDISITENSSTAIFPFFDDMEDDETIKNNWILSTWDKITTLNYSGNNCIADSPNGNGVNDVQYDLVLRGLLDLTDAHNPLLSFWHQYHSHSTYNTSVFISSNAGNTWDLLKTFSGTKNEWEMVQLDISAYAGRTDVSIMFRTKGHSSYDGWFLDDIYINNAPKTVTLHTPVNVTEHDIPLTWSKNIDNNFVKYEVYRNTSTNVNRTSGSLIASITDQNITSYTDTNIIKADTTYYYKVYVVNEDGFYDQGSNEISGTTVWDISSSFPFSDSMENGDVWLNELPWGISDDDAHTGTYAWSDSPGGYYENNMNKYLTLKVNLKNAIRPVLTFWHRYNLETNVDAGYLEISPVLKNSWVKFLYVTGFSNANWEQVSVDLSEYARSEIYIRFHIYTNASQVYDGWHIDDIEIKENNSVEAFPFVDTMNSKETLSHWITSTWDMIFSDGHSETICITDSPKGNGGLYVAQDLTLKGVFDFTEAINPQLSFWQRYHVATNYKNSIFISSNGGNNWTEIWTSSTGKQEEWVKEQVDLSEYKSYSNIAIKFRNYGHSSYDGWYLDDLLFDDAPVNVRLVEPKIITEHSIHLTWTESTADDFLQYELYRNMSPNVDRSHTLVATMTNPSIHSYTDTNLISPNQTYYYKLFVVDSTNLHNQGSNEVFGTTLWGIPEISSPMLDDMENGDQWGNDLPWAITDEDSHSGTYSWSDSPGGHYENNMDRSIYIKVNLVKTHRPLLEFWHQYNLEKYEDFGYIEVSTDYGLNWKKIYFITGYSGLNWEKVEIDLSSYTNREVMLRFRIITNNSQTYDGWHIDDVKISDNKTVISYPFYDDMESENTMNNWITSTWDKINTDSYSENHSLTDSPEGDSRTDVYSDLVLRGTIDLVQAKNPKLTFWQKYNCYPHNTNQIFVYVSNNGGIDWKDKWHTYSYTTNWIKLEVDLSEYSGLPDIAIKFTIRGWNGYKGWNIDDIRIGEDQTIPSFIQITSGDQQMVPINTSLSKPFVATVFDSNSLPVPDITVNFDITSEIGSLSLTQTQTNINGQVSTLYTSGPTSGDNTIKATIDGTEQSVTFTAISIIPGTAIQLTKLSGDRQAAEIRNNIANPFVVKVTDINNDPVAEVPISFYILSGSGTLSYTDGQTDENGIASSHLTIDDTPGKVVIMASSGGLKGSPVSFDAYGTLSGGSIGDVDGDKIADDWEIAHGFNSLDASDALLDQDEDNLINLLEYVNATNPHSSDTDSDQMPDGWEVMYGIDPNNPYDAMDDNDKDGLTNLEEYIANSIPVMQNHFQIAGVTDNWIDIYGAVTIDNIPAETGDEVAVFDPDGIVCGQFTVTSPGNYGFMHVFKDDSSTENIDEGAIVNDLLTFRIWDSSEEIEISASQNVLTGTQPLSWTFDGDLFQVNLAANGIFSIPLHKGWNLISFPIKTCYYIESAPGYADGKPDIPMLPHTVFKKVQSIADILLSIQGKYTVVRSSDKLGAHTFDPNLPDFSDMKYMACGYGYWIEMTEAGSLELQGVRANAADLIELSSGWNLVGYWHPKSQYHEVKPSVNFPNDTEFSIVGSVSDILSTIDGKYDVIRSFDSEGAHTFDPVLEIFSDLDYLGPGYGYWIKMKTAGQLSYE
ncbi:serine protease [Candidatus Magnetomorum sp. HK-1]|nr:serine protease [Candidatus Magnetomorum sp. HK-1]